MTPNMTVLTWILVCNRRNWHIFWRHHCASSSGTLLSSQAICRSCVFARSLTEKLSADGLLLIDIKKPTSFIWKKKFYKFPAHSFPLQGLKLGFIGIWGFPGYWGHTVTGACTEEEGFRCSAEYLTWGFSSYNSFNFVLKLFPHLPWALHGSHSAYKCGLAWHNL